MPSQTETIYEELVKIRPFSMTACTIYYQLDETIPKVSVNRALNELKARGKVAKLDKYAKGVNGRNVRLWRATYR